MNEAQWEDGTEEDAHEHTFEIYTGSDDHPVTLICHECDTAWDIRRHGAINAQSEALAIAVEAIEAAQWKFQRIQTFTLDDMTMARAMDGEQEACDALSRIAAAKVPA